MILLCDSVIYFYIIERVIMPCYDGFFKHFILVFVKITQIAHSNCFDSNFLIYFLQLFSKLRLLLSNANSAISMEIPLRWKLWAFLWCYRHKQNIWL